MSTSGSTPRRPAGGRAKASPSACQTPTCLPSVEPARDFAATRLVLPGSSVTPARHPASRPARNSILRFDLAGGDLGKARRVHPAPAGRRFDLLGLDPSLGVGYKCPAFAASLDLAHAVSDDPAVEEHISRVESLSRQSEVMEGGRRVFTAGGDARAKIMSMGMGPSGPLLFEPPGILLN